jgi:hypothetical protein
MKSLIAIILVPLLVLAIESINPHTICDRFTSPSEQKSCQARIQHLNPDSYLAGVCQKQFDNDAFWNCMELSKTASFDPKKADKCATSDMNDEQRIACLKQIANFSGDPQAEFQAMPRTPRAPAAKE